MRDVGLAGPLMGRAAKPEEMAGSGIGFDSKKFLQDWIDRYVAWVKRHAGS